MLAPPPVAGERIAVAAPPPPVVASPLEIADLAFVRAGVPVLARLHLDVAPGECVGVFGPTGAGKTTLLRLIAGLLSPSTGEIRLGGSAASTPTLLRPPHQRGVAMVFQAGALWPHMSAGEHLVEVLRARGVAEADALPEAARLLASVGLGDLAVRRPGELSGGEQQRLGLARAFAARPRVLLLDEPFAAVDRPTRARLLRLLEEFRRDTGACAVWVTHDVGDALEVSDRVAVLRDGRFEQVAAPARLHAEPASRFVAACVGFETFLPGVRVSSAECVTRWGRFPVAAGAVREESGLLALRASALAPDPAGPVRGVVVSCGFRDGGYALRLDCDGTEALVPSAEPRRLGESVAFSVRAPGVFVRE